MAPRPLTMNPSYLAMVRGTRELHRLSAAGKDDSSEADAVRDATDRPWESLSEIERQRVGNLSEDLYSLAEPPAVAQPMTPQAQRKLCESVVAKQCGEWDKALDLLRKWRAFIDPALVSYLRGEIWFEAGDPETAVPFLEHAVQLEPKNGDFLAFLLHALNVVDAAAAREWADKILRESDNFPPMAVASAANTAFMSIQTLSDLDAMNQSRKLIAILKNNLVRIGKGDEKDVHRSSYMMTLTLLGFCHEFLGEMQAAVDRYSEGIHADPDNDALLVARGVLLYGTSPRAEGDFEMAIRRISPMIWPYYFLAHDRLVHGRLEECRTLCERALEMPGSDAVKSELHEWLAISQAELGFPLEMVRKSFEAAIRQDPGNDRARRNMVVSEASVASVVKKAWETRSPRAVRTSGLAERRHALAA